MPHIRTAHHPDRTDPSVRTDHTQHTGHAGRTGHAARTARPVPHLADEGLEVPEDAVQRPGQTPPAESGVSGLDAPERKALSQGWGAAPIAVILFFVALFVAGVIAQVVALLV